jgi:hypothetical protein
MHRVKFVTKIVEAGDPEYRLLKDRTEQFASFSKAMEFVRSIRNRYTGREVLVGFPEVEVA